MVVSLIRYHNYSQAAMLQPETGMIRVVDRERKRGSDPPYWLPEVPLQGFFDQIGGLTIALYRDPDAPEVLWLQHGSARWALSGDAKSTFFPDISNDEPLLENADVIRTFRLFNQVDVVFEHTYTLNDGEQRLRHGMDPFPNWPDEEENYDLLFFVHRILVEGRWSRVLQIRSS